MRAQRFSDALLRSGPSPLLSFLAPSVSHSTWTPIYREFPSHVKRIQRPTSLRCLVTKTSALSASAATATTVEEDEVEVHPLPDHQAKKSSTDVIGGLISSIVETNASKPQPNSSRRQVTIPSREGRTSADLSRESRAWSRGYLHDKQGSIEGQAFPGEFHELDPAKLIRVASNKVTPALPLPPPVRLDAFVGRSEDVDPHKGVDLGRAIRRLEIKCAYNNVRQDFNKQRFHERPGLKRKRLKSQRWRKRFKEGFNAVVSKVQKMRMKGW
ncbi:hypothetical protein MMC30_002116 [Trapelia coarctata]|nr:hypothetical protein [Trapelia coarctata]